MSHAICLRGASKAFPTRGGPIETLTDINLDVTAGEVMAVVGASGCGKSTLLRLIAGLIPLTAGEMEIDGKVVDGPSPGTAVVFQAPILLPWHGVRRNVDRRHES